ncbi:MAG: DsrE family protein [Planctomycetes bacterium]|nr:DsrE family protein [Planctomycetota bacterium]
MLRAIGVSLTMISLALTTAPRERRDPPAVSQPRIRSAGGAAILPQAAFQPRKGAKIVFDISLAGKPEEINKGLERLARLLNLYAGHGMSPADLDVVAVLHGQSAAAGVVDETYAKMTGTEKNPNLPVLQELNAAGVKLFFCGQTLAQKKISPDDLAPELKVATSAMLVVVQAQADGYSVITLP